MIVSIKEYEKLYIREIRDLEHKCISREDSEVLQSILIDSTPVFSFGNRCLIAQHWIGVINLPDFTIEILPKISSDYSDADLRNIVTRMLMVSHQSASAQRIVGSVSTSLDSLSEIIIDAFLGGLEQYLKYGLLHSYEKIELETDKIKGRILFNKQLNQNILMPTSFYCRYSKYISDNYLNRFFKLCLIRMLKISNDARNIQRLKKSLTYFCDISDIEISEMLSNNIVFNSVNAIARQPYIYGEMFLKNIFATLRAGSVAVNMMLFDMNRLFEVFISKVAKLSFGGKVYYQQSGSYLIKSFDHDKKFINLRPDLIICNNENRFIVDTKWKIPSSFATESDIYQMNAYSVAINGIDKVYILYPLTRSSNNISGDYQFIDRFKNIRFIGIRTVDLGKCLNWKDFILYFKEIFDVQQNVHALS